MDTNESVSLGIVHPRKHVWDY